MTVEAGHATPIVPAPGIGWTGRYECHLANDITQAQGNYGNSDALWENSPFVLVIDFRNG